MHSLNEPGVPGMTVRTWEDRPGNFRPGDDRAGHDRRGDAATAFDETPVSDRKPLFVGDVGTLEPAVRDVLVQLLLGPSVDARRTPEAWQTLLLHEHPVRTRLNDLYLELVVDRELEVAYTRQVQAENLSPPILLRRHTLTFLDSVLVLYLRERLIQASMESDRAVVAKAEMMDHLLAFQTRMGDESRFLQQREASIDRMFKLGLLRKLKGAEDRSEVSPTLKLVVAADKIEAFTRAYAQAVRTARGLADAQGDGPEDMSDGPPTRTSDGLRPSQGTDGAQDAGQPDAAQEPKEDADAE